MITERMHVKTELWSCPFLNLSVSPIPIIRNAGKARTGKRYLLEWHFYWSFHLTIKCTQMVNCPGETWSKVLIPGCHHYCFGWIIGFSYTNILASYRYHIASPLNADGLLLLKWSWKSRQVNGSKSNNEHSLRR